MQQSLVTCLKLCKMLLSLSSFANTSTTTTKKNRRKSCLCFLSMLYVLQQPYKFYKFCAFSKTGIIKVGKNLQELEALIVTQN